MSKELKLTDWFPADVKPVHVGIYECRNHQVQETTFYYYWNGTIWEYGGQPSIHLVFRCKKKSTVQNKIWRGLTAPHPEWKP